MPRRLDKIADNEWQGIINKEAGLCSPKMVKKRQNKNTMSAWNVPIMIPELAVALERDRKTSDSVMPHGQGSFRRVKPEQPVNPGYVRKRLQVILERAGCKRVRVHDLRHPNVKPKTQIFYPLFLNKLSCTQAHRSISCLPVSLINWKLLLNQSP